MATYKEIAKDDFHHLSSKFLFIMSNFEKEYNSEALNFLLNELNSLDFKACSSIGQVASEKLLQYIPKIPANEETLVVKSCYLIIALIQYHKIKLQQESLNELIDWLLKALNINFKSVICDILETLRVLIKANFDKISKFHDVLLGHDGLLISRLSNPNLNKDKKVVYENNTPEEITLSAILCIESFFKLTDENSEINIPGEYVINIGNRMINLAYTTNVERFGETNYCSLMTSTLNICRAISWINKAWGEEKLEDLLGIAQAFLMYKLPNVIHSAPKKIMASQRSLLEPNATKMNPKFKAKTRRPAKFSGPFNEKIEKNTSNISIDTNMTNNLEQEFSSFSNPLNFRTSDSDYSESETSRIHHERKQQAKLRQSALTLIGILSKIISKHTFFGYWHCFFPTTMTENSVCLLNSVVKDHSPNCRISALQTISFIFFKSKPYLIQADLSQKTPSSFTPFSITLGNMLISIYAHLTDALINESSLQVIMQILKCLTIFIQESPFKNFAKPLQKRVIIQARRLVYHKDVDIQVTSLVVLEAILSSMETLEDMSDILEDMSIKNVETIKTASVDQDESIETEIYSDDEEIDNIASSSSCNNENRENILNPTVSWILQRVLENLGVNPLNIKTYYPPATSTIRIESLQVLSVLASHYILLKDNLESITMVLVKCFNDQNIGIHFFASKCLKAVGNGANNYFSKQEIVTQDDIDAYLNFWLKVLPCVFHIIQNPIAYTRFHLKIVLFEAIGNIGVHVFERLPNNIRITLITLLSGNEFEDDIEIRAAAIRTLGVFVLFPSLKDDICFIENTAETIINLLERPEDSIQSTASWALGNAINSFDSENSEKMSNNLLERLIKTCMKASDKTSNGSTQCNLMRSLGSLLKLLNDEHFNILNWNDMFLEAINKLVTNGLNKGQMMKPRWNTCYALATVLKNPYVYHAKCCQQWQNIIYPNLCNTIKKCVNFKVRTNGALALSIPPHRSGYGIHFLNIWTSFLIALEHTDDLIDYIEYKHRDNLMNQLCLSLAHMLKLMTKDDIIPMANQLVGKCDVIKVNWNRVINRFIADKATPLIEATLKLQNYNLNELSLEQSSAIKILSSCFTPVTEYL